MGINSNDSYEKAIAKAQNYVRNHTNLSSLNLPQSLKGIILDFLVDYSKADFSKRDDIKKRFVTIIIESYKEYCNLFFRDYNIPFISNFELIYNNIKNKTRHIIYEYNLEEFEEIILDNFVLNRQNLLNIAEFCYNKTKNISRTCEIYCYLGYATYSNRYGNEEYLIYFIQEWMHFCQNKQIEKEVATRCLHINFLKMDTEELDCFPFTGKEIQELLQYDPLFINNINKLIDYILEFDIFNSKDDYLFDKSVDSSTSSINGYSYNKIIIQCKDDTVIVECNNNDYEYEYENSIISNAITPKDICQYIFQHLIYQCFSSNTTDNIQNLIINNLATEFNINKNSTVKDLENAALNIAERIEYYSKKRPNRESNNEIFCVFLAPTEDTDIRIVKPITDINQAIYALLPEEKKGHHELKVNTTVKIIDASNIDIDSESEINADVNLDNIPPCIHNQGYRYGYLDDSYVRKYDTLPYLSILSNHYIYLFNKAENQTPYALFSVCIFSRWLLTNINYIEQFIPELSSTDLHSLLLDYSAHHFDTKSMIPDDDDLSYCLWLPDDQKEVIDLIYDLKEKRPISNLELVDFWKYIVLEKGLLFKKGHTVENPIFLNVKESPYPENGDLLLPWKYVRYVDGKAFFYHPNHERGINAILPFIHKSKTSKKIFSELSKFILWKFPPIKCKCIDGKIIMIDSEYANHVISTIQYFHEQFVRKDRIRRTSDSIIAKDILRRYKSFQLQFLQGLQLANKQIIPIKEKFCSSSTDSYHEEPALLFSIGQGTNTMTLAFENVSISRATYLFIIKRDSFDNAVRSIQKYFTSETKIKRQMLQYSRDMFSISDGILKVIRVIHDDNKNWQSTIRFYTKNC